MIIFGFTNPEIAKELGLSVNQVANYARRYLKGNANHLKRITKHKHIIKDVMKYFLGHTEQECLSKFNITKSEFKSIMTMGYRDKNLTCYRKDTRRRDPWSKKELHFLLRWSGVLSTTEINNYLKRGVSKIVIKEKLISLGLASKNVNGLSYSQFTSLFKKEPLYYLKTAAGSPGSNSNSYSYWKIVPWMHVKEMLGSGYINHTESVKIYIEVMALFQRWVHGKDYWKSLTSVPAFEY